MRYLKGLKAVTVCMTGLALAYSAAATQPPSAILPLLPHHATASVQDLDRAIAWYQSKLGMTLSSRGERPDTHMRFAELAMPGYGIGLVQFPRRAATPGAATASPPGPPAAPAWLHIVFSTPDLAAAKEYFEGLGVQVEARSNNGKLTALEIRDSEGNEIELVAP